MFTPDAEGHRRRGLVLDGERRGRAAGAARALGDPATADDPDIAGHRGGQSAITAAKQYWGG